VDTKIITNPTYDRLFKEDDNTKEFDQIKDFDFLNEKYPKERLRARKAYNISIISIIISFIFIDIFSVGYLIWNSSLPEKGIVISEYWFINVLNLL